MGDWYQVIADIDADEKSAAHLAARLQNWMIAQQIIVADKTDCVLSKSLGHKPGALYHLATEEPHELIFETNPNGAEFISEHTVFYSSGLDEIWLVCSSCAARFKSGDAWGTALEDWYKFRGPGLLACSICNVKVPITEWLHHPPWAFGNLGVKFWNWPRLRQEFLTEVSKLLDGHRVRLVYGKV